MKDRKNPSGWTAGIRRQARWLAPAAVAFAVAAAGLTFVYGGRTLERRWRAAVPISARSAGGESESASALTGAPWAAEVAKALLTEHLVTAGPAAGAVTREETAALADDMRRRVRVRPGPGGYAVEACAATPAAAEELAETAARVAVPRLRRNVMAGVVARSESLLGVLPERRGEAALARGRSYAAPGAAMGSRDAVAEMRRLSEQMEAELAERRALEARLQVLETRLAESLASLPAKMEAIQGDVIGGLIFRLQTQQEEYLLRGVDYTPEASAMVRLREDMEDTLAAISRAVAAAPERAGEPGPWRRYEGLLRQRADWENRLAGLEVSIAALRSRIEALTGVLGDSGGASLAAARAGAQADALEAALEEALRESAKAQAAAELRAASIGVDAPVLLRDRFGGPILSTLASGGAPLLAGLAGVAALLASFALALAVDRARSPRRALRRLARRTSMPVLAAVPGPGPETAVPGAWLTNPPGAFQGLYAQLSVVVFRGEPVRVALADPEESAATPYAAACLAAAAAHSGAATLLIDAGAGPWLLDHAVDVPGDTGLIDVLHGQASLRQVIRATQVDGLSYLPRGGVLAGARAVAEGERFAEVVAEAASGYGAVFCSAPGVLLRGEALRYIDALGACVFVAPGPRAEAAPLLEARRLVVAKGVSAPGLVAAGARRELAPRPGAAGLAAGWGAKAALW